MKQTLSLPWLLLATPQLNDPNFAKSVVLIMEHGATGSMGFIVNRPLQTSLANLVDAPAGETDQGTSSVIEIPDSIPAWYGGPVGKGSGIILHNQRLSHHHSTSVSDELSGTFKSSEHLYLTSDAKTLVDLVNYEKKRQKYGVGSAGGVTLMHAFRFLVGYAGWDQGQLEEEMREGAWLQAPVSDEVLFATSWAKMWDKAMEKVGVRPVTLAPTSQTYLN